MILAGAELVITLSKEVASLGEAKAFNYFPKFRMVSCHSVSFSDAAETPRLAEGTQMYSQNLNT